ncbi:MAG TPA: hypothetical protein VG692_09430 [Gemmatimonadales bacterium]|nr:hypothetical protein [Gemmatimonadales bacterium]
MRPGRAPASPCDEPETLEEIALPSRYAFALTPRSRRSPAGVTASILLHVLLGILLLYRIQADFARVLDAGAENSGPRGGGGGGAGRVAYITLPAPAAAAPKAVAVEPPKEEPKPVPVPTPTPTPPPVIPPPVQEQVPVAVVTPTPTSAPSTGDSVAGRGPGVGGGEGGGKGGGSGPGVGPGRGPGVGTGGGEGGTGRAPRPRYELIPPTDDPPKELRGKEVRIRFSIDVDGKVRRVTFDPEIPGGKYARRLKETMEGYRFIPATGPDGAAVPGTFEYTMTVF